MPKLDIDYSQAELRVIASSPRLARAIKEALEPPRSREDQKRKQFAKNYGASPETVYKMMRGGR